MICATNRNLKDMVDQGRFSEDLYDRLAAVEVQLPPLKDRRDDIPLLVDHFMEQYSNDTGRRSAGISDDAIDLLAHHPWPGNIRQLANAIQYALIKCRGGQIKRDHLPPELLNGTPLIRSRKPGRPPKLDPKEVEDALKKNQGNRAKAARDLGVARSTLYRYLEELAED
jgi:DNA-binding NtrC family response regulator